VPVGGSSRGLNRTLVLVLLLAILVLALGLRVTGLTWGVPREPHYRNYYQDERFVLGLLFKMNPAHLNFDPNYFINPSLHYYTMMGALLKSNLLGLNMHLPVSGASSFKPDDMSGATYTDVFLIGRMLVMLESLLAVLLIFLVGRGLYNQKTGLFAALLMAVSYPVMYQGRFFTADGPALFWLVLSFYFVIRFWREPERRRWRILAPIGIGLALGAKYLNVLVVLPYFYVLFNLSRTKKGRSFVRPAVTSLLTILATFLVTTPYALLSFGTFLHGDQNGFGGLFGARGLMYYNNFPSSLIEPFSIGSLAAMNGLGLLTFALALVVLFARRKPQDRILLAFIVPFYLMLIYKASPNLRHILPVLPLVFLACAATLSEPAFLKWRSGPAGPILLGVVALSWLGLSLAAVLRMAKPDTRVQAEEWVKRNVTTETIALPTYFPYRYTPAIDSFHLMPLNYDARRLEQAKPEYLLMTEPEYRIDGKTDDKAGLKESFMSSLAGNPNYRLAQRIAEPFQLFGLTFNPNFPTEDWSFPSPEILIYRRQ
jgi:hypothetical protein